MTSFNWTCPYCNHAQTVTDQQFALDKVHINHSQSVYGPMIAEISSIRCANDDCKQLQLAFYLHVANTQKFDFWIKEKLIRSWNLLPESLAKPQPSYIPEPIVEDYKEACLIRDLSPKASATLSRRCLQGIIRDFCRISDRTLFLEIDTLKKQVKDGKGPKQVLEDTVDAIDAVRKIGSIGAHMEKDINVIIDVEPMEAQKLIDLIELLFREWYVQRHNRAKSLENLREIADVKQEERKK